MIYLFNDVKELTGTVRNSHILNLLYEREKNGIYSVSAEIPVTYNDQGTIYNYNKKIQKSDFLGHYDREGRFQLHKIAAVDIENGSIFVKGIHIFFDEAKAGAIIQDRRFINREIIDGARAAFESIGWSVVDFDVSVGKTYNFYNVTPLEARQILVETFGFEFDYWLDFDGKKVTNRHIAVKEKIGEKTNKRYTYGHNVLNIRAEQDYSEIYTAVIGRGKGEEIEETGGYGRRIEYTDVVWTTPSKPLNKPAGTRILEDPNATQLFGYKENGVVKPRIKVEVFSDIESPTELIQASYEWLMDNNVPKAVFSLKVADGDGLNLGDEVYVIYRDIDLVKSARVEKVIDDLVSGNRDVEFGDTAYFDTDRRLSGLRSDLKRHSGETGDRIYRLKMEFNRRFDEEVSSWVAEYEQALIDAAAAVEAMRVEMEEEISTIRTDMSDRFESEKADVYEEAQRNYAEIENYVNTTVDTTRNQVEQSINTAEQSAKDYAEQQAQEKSNSVQSDLDSFKNSHQQLYDEVTGNLSQTRTDLLERINNIDTQSFNLIRGSRFDEMDRYATSGGTVHDDEDMPYFRYGISSGNIQYISTVDDIQFEAGKTYTLSLDYRTSSDVSIDYLRIIPTDGSADINIRNYITESDMAGIIPDGEWHRTFLTFTVPRNLTGTLRLGSDFSTSVKGQADIRLPYLTTSGNVQWVFHPSDSYESIISVMSRIDEFEQSVWAELEDVYGNLSSTRTELQKQLDAARAELEGIEVGGRNLFREGNEETRIIELDARDVLVTSGYYLSSGIASGNPLIISHNLENGETYTLSGRLHAPNHPTVVGHNNIKILYEDGLVTIGKFPSNYEYHSFTFKIDENRKFVNLHFDVGVYDAYIESKTLKLEKGNIATDWTPAPEDTEHKITTLNQQIEYIDGQLSAKLEQTDIDPINNKITEYGNSLTANAQSIESLINKTELHDDDITQWSNLTTETAEGLERTIGRVSTAEGKLSNAEFDIKANADSLKLTATKTEVENAIDGIEVGGRNIIPNSADLLDWSKWSLNTTIVKMPSGMHRVSRVNPATAVAIGIHSKDGFVLKAGNEYTLSYKAYDYYDALPNYIYILSSEQGNTQLNNSDIKLLGRTGTLVNQSLYANQYKLTFTFTKDVKDGRILIGYNGGTTSKPSIGFYISDVQLEKGNKSTDWSPAPEDTDAKISKVTSDFEIEAGRIEGLVTDISTDYVKQSSVKVTSDRVTIGSTVVNGSTIGSVLSVSPTGIDAVADAMRLSGDLLVAGDVTALAVKAIEGDFAQLFAAEVTAGSVHADYVEGFAGRFSSLYTLNANIERLVAQHVFTNAVHAKSLDAIEANIGRVRTAFLKADVIKGSHISSNTIEVKHLTGYDAILNTLMARTVFSNEVKALSIDAVEANIGSIRSKILDSDVILSSHINSSNALIDKIFSSSARFERMMAKSAFVNTLNTVSLHANSFSSSIPGSNREITMENGRARFRYGSIVIENASGRRTIIDGKINRSQTMTARMPRFQSSEVAEDGSWYRSSSTAYVTAHEEYFIHEARHIRVAMAVHRWGMSGWCDGRMETRSGKISNFITTENDSSAVYDWLKIDMGEPLDRPVSDSLMYMFKSRNGEQAKRMHLGNRFLTDFPENL